MKNIYYVISSDGQVYNPHDYLEEDFCSEEMSVCIKREVLGEQIECNNSSDYIKSANKLGFSWEKNSAIGFINYNYNANLIMKLVQEYARSLVEGIGLPIYEVKGSNFFNMNYPVVQEYVHLFGDRLFKFNSDKDELVMGYDASYPQFNLACDKIVREENLPYAHFSISDCYRYEQSGECMLLYRNRRFHMPDIHPYFKDIDDAWDWYPKLEEKLIEGFRLAKKKYINIAKIGSLKNWEEYKERVVDIAKRNNVEVLVDIKNDNEDRYWIVDIDYSFIDSLKQVREIGCIQIDIGNAKRLGIEFVDRYGSRRFPVIIHSAIPGGIERYIYMLIDNMSEFPLEFKPIQLRLAPVGEKYIKQSLEVYNKYKHIIRIDIDDRSVGVSKKIKDAHHDYISNILLIGQKEVDDQSIIDSYIKNIIDNLNPSVPFIKNNWEILMSRKI